MDKYALIGENISYTLSPKLHKMFFKEMGIEADYIVEDGYNQEDRGKFIKGIIDKIRKGELKGLNITVPYKEEILKYLDILDFEAEKIGSVNTIVLENGKVKGYNTDYLGVLATFDKMKVDIEGQKVYILGNGGSARAVVHAVNIRNGIPQIVSRKKDNPNRKDDDDKTISYLDVEKLVSRTDVESFLVNTTPIGNINSIELSPISKSVAERFKGILDLHYRPLKTKLMGYSSKNENGLYMLVIQGIESEKIWNKNFDFSDKKDIIEKIYKSLKGELEKNG